jgi:hypothetical protein
MDSAYLPAVAALAGSAIGGLTSFASAWLTQHRQDRTRRLSQDKARRQKVYKQFIEEASKLYADALVHDDLQISTLVSAYALISRMRLLSSPPVLQRAEAVVQMIVETYFAPNKTSPELRELLDSHAIDPLRAFSEVCRSELEPLKGFRDAPLRGHLSGTLHQDRDVVGHMEQPLTSGGTRPSRVVAPAQGSSTDDSTQGAEENRLNQGAAQRTVELSGSTRVQ